MRTLTYRETQELRFEDLVGILRKHYSAHGDSEIKLEIRPGGVGVEITREISVKDHPEASDSIMGLMSSVGVCDPPTDPQKRACGFVIGRTDYAEE